MKFKVEKISILGERRLSDQTCFSRIERAINNKILRWAFDEPRLKNDGWNNKKYSS